MSAIKVKAKNIALALLLLLLASGAIIYVVNRFDNAMDGPSDAEDDLSKPKWKVPLHGLEMFGDADPNGSVMSSMGNQTLRAELGRAAWTLLHVLASRFPETPTEEEKSSFISFIYLFSRLYPCGDCAREFRKILVKHPPVVNDRDSVIQWLCTVHNVVNARLGKEIFPCERVKDRWKCGCVDEV